MSKPTTPHDLLVQEIKELYSMENQLIRALPRMAKIAHHEELKNAFLRHLEETKRHAQRIESIMEKLAASPRGKKSKATEALLEDGRDVMDDAHLPPAIRDLALIAAAQKIEHHEMAGYGCARMLADLIGESELAETFQETLDEEGAADKLLTEVAMGINIETGMVAGD